MKVVLINDERPLIFEHDNKLFVKAVAEIREMTGLVTKIETDLYLSENVNLPYVDAIELSKEVLNNFKLSKEGE